jgi:hypothetical protein
LVQISPSWVTKNPRHMRVREKIALGGKTQKCLDLVDATVALWLPSVALVAGNPHGNNPYQGLQAEPLASTSTRLEK